MLRHGRGGQPGRGAAWLARLGAGLLLVLICTGGADAVGPFSHLILAQRVAPFIPGGAAAPEVRQALHLGAIALDAGYYPGAESRLAEAGHNLAPWSVCRALLDLAENPAERAFAIGYLSHALIDQAAHRELVNPLTGAAFSVNPLDHKRIEWGLDCWWLSQPGNQWLWQAADETRPASPAGLALWRRALERAYGVRLAPQVLGTAVAAELKTVDELPLIFQLSGQARRPGGWLGNGLGWLLGWSARPLAVGYMRWRGGYMNEIAILDAQPAAAADVANLERLMAGVAVRLADILAGGALPQGNLDADPACDTGGCVDTEAAKAWLAGLPKAE
ncbi:MAG: zinc dependent phospholipase C family protein [Pseudomonadota bacterium]